MVKRIPTILSGLLLLSCGTPFAKTAETMSDKIEKPAISKGMSLKDALKVLRKNGVRFEEVATAIASDKPNEQLREFLIRPQFKSSDAIEVIAAAHIKSDDYVIRQIGWHLDWEQDSTYPLSLRSNRILYLEELEMIILEETPQKLKDKRASLKIELDENPFDF